MIKYEIEIEDGDYLWDSVNKKLIKYSTIGSVVIGAVPNSYSINVAFPIVLNEDVLNAIGFHCNGKAGYDDNNGNTIMIDGTCKESILVLQGKPVRYVSDVQNICRLNGTPPSIDENCLSNACNRTP